LEQRGGAVSRELVVNTFVSLDGVMQAPGGPEEDPTGGFELGGWTVPHWNDEADQAMGEFMGKPFDLVLGRKTYEIFAAHWPHSDDPGAAELNRATKYVASRTLTDLEWENSQLLEGDVGQAIARLKQENGPELQVHGSSDLIQTLHREGLVDRYQIFIFPVVLGKGKRLFAEGAPPATFELVDGKVFGTGVVWAAFEPAGEVQTGSFALEEPTEAELRRRENL
jgi:dihydrofolate reductase